MRVKEDKPRWEEESKSPKELDLFLAELHQKQHPDVFSEIGLSLGWCQQQAPPTLTTKVMERIVEESKGKLFSSKMFWAASLLSVLMLLVAAGFLTKLGDFSGLTDTVRTEVGLFWLVASLGVSLFTLTTSFLVGEQLIEKRLGFNGGKEKWIG
ncbi:MAG TPA: hypothetical protein DDW93_03925 [Firmicutes bacterium]|nr:hypothetical protein [Bacillota bacterium]HBK68900.1 hypothetical protein [Bacillota bacterium]HBT15467.1 hypothetical protein [Bacillota bacterium]